MKPGMGTYLHTLSDSAVFIRMISEPQSTDSSCGNPQAMYHQIQGLQACANTPSLYSAEGRMQGFLYTRFPCTGIAGHAPEMASNSDFLENLQVNGEGYHKLKYRARMNLSFVADPSLKK
ncbi:hypothetical protein STEG23_013759, partial [Scotinomys teguina]